MRIQMAWMAAALVTASIVGCAPTNGNLPFTATETETDAEEADAAATTKSVALTDAYCAEAPGPGREAAVCRRWRCAYRHPLMGAAWAGGNSESCAPGVVDEQAAARALELVNAHRFLADVPPVVAEPMWSAAAQECALVAHANAKLSHTPGKDWKCWSKVAAETSANSLIANRNAPMSIAAYVEDPGNATTMVHRRWLLTEELLYVGFGSTDKYSCVVVDGRPLDGGWQAAPRRARAPEVTTSLRGWVAWPPAGPVPMDVFEAERLDEAGWTVQSATDDFAHVTVEVTLDGKPLPIDLKPLQEHQGSRGAVSFTPVGWKTEAGKSYKVTVVGAERFDYTVEPTDCAAGAL